MIHSSSIWLIIAHHLRWFNYLFFRSAGASLNVMNLILLRKHITQHNGLLFYSTMKNTFPYLKHIIISRKQIRFGLIKNPQHDQIHPFLIGCLTKVQLFTCPVNKIKCWCVVICPLWHVLFQLSDCFCSCCCDKRVVLIETL